MQINKLDLLSRGWTPKEIMQASDIIAHAEDTKHIGVKFLDKSIYWAMFFLVLVINYICTIVMIPFIFYINNVIVDFIVACIGLVFGVLFSVLITDIEHFEHKHHQSLIIAFALSAALNFLLIMRLASSFSRGSGLPLSNPPIAIASIYLISFLAPYISMLIHKMQKPKTNENF